TTTVITTSEFVANSSFLVGQHKLYPDVVKVFKISGQTNAYTLTLAACPDFTVGSVASGDLPNFNWSIWDSPPNSLTLEVDTTDFTTVSTTPKNYYFSIINTADFYVSGKTEITILNHISDANGDEIGLADVLADYTVLETEDASKMFDVTSQATREAYCGLIASYNPLGLAAGMVELNTINAYKVIPLDIAATERDPDAPLSYSGRYYPGEENPNYHNVDNLDWPSAIEVLKSVKDTQVPYYLIPLSEDQSIMSSFSSLVDTLAVPSKKKEMITFLSTKLPEVDYVFSNINYSDGDFSIDGNDILRFTPSTYYASEAEPNKAVNFLNIGAKKGQYVSYFDDTSGEEILLQIRNIYPTYIDLGENSAPSNVDTDLRVSIKKIYSNKTEMISALVSRSIGY